MWGNYHRVRCCSAYTSAWKSFLGHTHNLETEGHPAIFWQCVGDGILKTLIEKNFPVISQEAAVKIAILHCQCAFIPIIKYIQEAQQQLTFQGVSILYQIFTESSWYITSSIPESIHFLVTYGGSRSDREGLTHVNEMAFQVFLAMELELRNHLQSQHIPNFKTEVRKEILENEDVAFYWSILSCDWEVDESQALLELVVDLFLMIRGFSYASAWMEKYKAAEELSLPQKLQTLPQLIEITILC